MVTLGKAVGVRGLRVGCFGWRHRRIEEIAYIDCLGEDAIGIRGWELGWKQGRGEGMALDRGSLVMMLI